MDETETELVTLTIPRNQMRMLVALSAVGLSTVSGEADRAFSSAMLVRVAAHYVDEADFKMLTKSLSDMACTVKPPTNKED